MTTVMCSFCRGFGCGACGGEGEVPNPSDATPIPGKAGPGGEARYRGRELAHKLANEYSAACCDHEVLGWSHGPRCDSALEVIAPLLAEVDRLRAELAAVTAELESERRIWGDAMKAGREHVSALTARAEKAEDAIARWKRIARRLSIRAYNWRCNFRSVGADNATNIRALAASVKREDVVRWLEHFGVKRVSVAAIVGALRDGQFDRDLTTMDAGTAEAAIDHPFEAHPGYDDYEAVTIGCQRPGCGKLAAQHRAPADKEDDNG